MTEKTVECDLSKPSESENLYVISAQPSALFVTVLDEQQVTIRWTLPDGGKLSFPERDYFQWKPGVSAEIPERVSGTLLTLTYMPALSRWPYTVYITDGAITIGIDPEVDNVRPGVPFPKDWLS